jgi:hypothetical protein
MAPSAMEFDVETSLPRTALVIYNRPSASDGRIRPDKV